MAVIKVVKRLLVLRFVFVVQLLEHAFAQLLDHRFGIERWIEHRDNAVQERYVLKVGVDRVSDTWILNFDHDLLAAGQLRSMNLANRRCCQRLVVEAWQRPAPAAFRAPARRRRGIRAKSIGGAAACSD